MLSTNRIVFILVFFLIGTSVYSQSLTIQSSAAGRRQIMDGFGTCLSGTEGQSAWMQNLYYDDAMCSILRMDLVPRFISPYSDNSYNSPWFHNNPSLPGPDNNNVRTYTNATDYSRLFNNRRAPIAVMGPDINDNITKYDFNNTIPKSGIEMARAGYAKRGQLGDFKFFGSIWSPAPWLKISSGNTYEGANWPLPVAGTPFPFIWFDNFTGGRLDVSNTPRSEFFDGVENTSALTQFARGTAAYVKGIQDRAGVRFYAISIQNELNFETFYNSCTYPLSIQYMIALKAVRAEFDKYPDLRDIKLIGPEDLLGDNAYALWQYGGGSTTVHKNLQYLTEIAKDADAQDAIDFYCIHGYAADGVSSGGANPVVWDWWSNGWTTSPAPGIPSNVRGFTYYNKKSWMTETSGEDQAWLYPTSGFPNNGAYSIALKMHQAITAGNESAWIYWQFTDGGTVGASTLTDATSLNNAPKLHAFRHFSKYIRPNAVRLTTTVSGTSDVVSSAYIHDANKSLTVVLINTSASPRTVTVNVPTLPFTITRFDTYTSSNGSYWQSNPLLITGGTVSVTIPGYGVTTLFAEESAPLGVESIQVFGKKVASDVQLKWIVSGEKNVAYYDIQKSFDGITFSPVERVIRTGVASYSVTLTNTFENYFRIAVVDVDGTTEYSNILYVSDFNSSFVQVFPNPSSTDLFITINSISSKEDYTIDILNSLGQVVRSIYIEENSYKLSVSDLPSGMYTIVCKSPYTLVGSQRVIISH
jgi:O-glycosyl hydrolase